MDSPKLKADEWRCTRCGCVNKTSHQYCDQCFNKPVLGKRPTDAEGRAYTTDTERNDE